MFSVSPHTHTHITQYDTMTTKLKPTAIATIATIATITTTAVLGARNIVHVYHGTRQRNGAFQCSCSSNNSFRKKMKNFPNSSSSSRMNLCATNSPTGGARSVNANDFPPALRPDRVTMLGYGALM